MCHENVVEAINIRRCSCKKLARARYDQFNGNVDTKTEGWVLVRASVQQYLISVPKGTLLDRPGPEPRRMRES